MSQLLVNEVFQTIQGEGSYTGTPSIFIRLQGCPVGCPWCDTKHTWNVLPENEVSANIIMQESAESPRYFKASVKQLLDLFVKQNYTAKHIVITGGEPCMFDLTEFSENAKRQGFSVQIETSGTFNILCDSSVWVTLSPKINMKAGMPVLTQAMLRANEIKHPIAMQKHIDELDDLLQHTHTQAALINERFDCPQVYLQPISQQERATELAIQTCIKRNWRLSVQLHKYIGVE